MNELISEIVIQGSDDWVNFSHVVYMTRTKYTDSPDKVRSAVLELVRELLSRGLMAVGKLVRSGDKSISFVPWTETVDEIIALIDERWKAAAHPMDVCWLSNTANGDQLAKSLSDSTGRS